MPLQITPITHADVDGAVTCIQRSFSADPYYLWVFPNQSLFSPDRNRASLRTRCLWGMRYALFHVAKDSSSATPDEVLGVACWLPPSLAAPAPAAPSWGQYLQSWISYADWRKWATVQASSWSLWLSQLATNTWYGGRGGLSVRRYYLWKEKQAQAQEAIWDDTAGYYFCNIVTVLPEAQGKGVGKALMQFVTQTADREGRKCYLESSRNEPNVQIYEKMGFKLVREMRCQEDEEDQGITLYCMTREPAVQ